MNPVLRKIRKLIKLWKLKGPAFVSKKMLTKVVRPFWQSSRIDVFRYQGPDFRMDLPEGYDLELRRLSVDDYDLISDEIKMRPEVFRSRIEQGAGYCGVLWNGRVTDYCWYIAARTYHDKRDGCVLFLRPDEAYIFDYRAIRKNRPLAFSRYRLMKVVGEMATRCAAEGIGKDLVYYSLVDVANRPSMAFHKRYLDPVEMAIVRRRRFLRWTWVSRSDRKRCRLFLPVQA